MTAPVSLTDPSVQEEDGNLHVSLDEGNSEVPPILPVAQSRAEKAHFGLGHDSPGLDVLSAGIIGGQEPELRQAAANREDTKLEQTRTGMLTEIAKQFDEKTPEGSIGDLQTLIRTQLRTNPDTVFEKKFAQRLVDTAVSMNSEKDSVWGRAINMYPDALLHNMDVTTELIRRREGFLKLAEDISSRYDKMGLLNSVGYGALNLIPFYQTYQSHNILKTAPGSSYLMGSNMADQIRNLNLMPIDDAMKAAKMGIEDLYGRDPAGAVAFAHALTSFSVSNQVMGDFTSASDYAMLLPYGTVSKYLGRGTQAAAAGQAAASATGRFLTPAEISAMADKLPSPNRMMTPLELQRASAGVSGSVGGTQVTPRAMTSGELARANLAANSDNPNFYPTNAARNMSPEQIERAKVGLSTPDVATREDRALPEIFGPPIQPPKKNYITPQNWVRRFSGQEEVSQEVQGPRGVRFPEKADTFPRNMTVDELARAAEGTPQGRMLEPQEISQMKVALAHIVKGTEQVQPKIEEYLAAAGDTERASIIGAAKDVQKRQAAGTASVADAEDLMNVLPSIYKPQAFITSGGALSREARVRLGNEAAGRIHAIQQGLDNIVRVPRGPNDALQAALLEAKVAGREEFRGNANNAVLDIIDMQHIPAEDFKYGGGKPNTDVLAIHLGRRDGRLFENQDVAKFHAEWHGLDPKDYEIKQQGSQFYIQTWRPVSETGAFRNTLISTNNETPTSLLTTLLGTKNVRSAEDLVSKFQRDNRHLATHAPQELRRILKDDVTFITDLSKGSRADLRRVLEANHIEKAPGATREGYWFKDQGELEMGFQRIVGRLPTEKESRAYMAYVRLNDIDYVLRNLGVLRDKLRQGRQQFMFHVDQEGKWTKVDPFEGVKVKDVDWTNPENENIFVYNSHSKTSFFDQKHGAERDFETFKTMKALVDDLTQNKGYKVVRVASPLDRPLKEATGVKDVIHYVVTDGWETKPISPVQVEYRPGGHRIYQDKWWVKQPKIAAGTGGAKYYWGDATISSYSSEAEANKMAQAWETGRQMMGANHADLANHVNRNLGMTEADFRKLFDANNFLDPAQPILHTFSAQTTSQFHSSLFQKMFPNIRNYARSASNLDMGIDSKFLADRDPMQANIRNVGTDANPIIVQEKARILDPYTALNRGLGQAIRATYMNDYKIGAVESWINEFSHLILNGDQAPKNPFYHFYNPRWQTGTDRDELMAAQNSRSRILNFLGVDSELGQNVRWIEQKGLNAVYNRFGGGAADWTDAHLLPYITDPTVYMRKIAFHSRIGLFNPAQILVQSQMFAHAIAIGDPAHSMQGFAGGILARFNLHSENPAVIDRMASIASKFGWDPEHWKEMRGALQNSGFANVSGETAWKNDFFDPRLFTSAAGAWLDKGTIFFSEADRLPRMSSFATSYREWRAENPTARLDNRSMGTIMTRADMLSGNMTRASNSALQEGVFSPATQFMTFNQRLAEQMLGGRLTGAEKARVVGLYSAMYGVPVTASIPLVIEPLYDDMRQAALERGIQVNDSWYTKAFMDGLPAMFHQMITGKDYDFARRLGPGAGSLAKDLRDGNKDIAELVLGASGQIAYDFLKSSYPATMGLVSYVKGTPDFPLMVSDFEDVAKNLSVANNGVKMWMAINYHKFVSKGERNIASADSIDGIYAMLGFTPGRVLDLFGMQNSLKEQEKAQKFFKDHAMQEIERAFEPGHDDASTEAHLRRASSYITSGDLNDKDRADIMIQASKMGVGTLEDKLPLKFWQKGPKSEQPAREDMVLKGPQ